MIRKGQPHFLHTAQFELPVHIHTVGHEPVITSKAAAHPVVISRSLDSLAIMFMDGPVLTLTLLATVACKFAPRAVSHSVAPSHLLTKQL